MTRIELAIEVRFLKIPTEWRRGTPDPQLAPLFPDKGSVVVPAVSQDAKRRMTQLDGWDIRNRFLRLQHDESAALAFLADVGVWNAGEDHATSRAKAGQRLLSGAFSGRYFNGYAYPLFLAELWTQQASWRDRLTNHSALKASFGSPPGPTVRPADQLRFAAESTFFNALPLRVEWRGRHPFGVIETITGHELLIATTHIDLLRGAKFKICKRKDCAIPFSADTQHERKYCEWYCGHIESVRNQRRKGEHHGKDRPGRPKR